MFHLIKRDVILQKKQLLIFIPFILFFIFMDVHPVLTFLVASVFIPFNTYAYDEKAETNILLNSLPYTRKEIIASRYLGVNFLYEYCDRADKWCIICVWEAVFAVRYCDWQRVVFIVRGVYVSIVLYLKAWLYHNGSDHWLYRIICYGTACCSLFSRAIQWDH